MAITVQQIHPVAHLPLVLGVLRRLEVATLIDGIIPPHPAHGLSCGRGVEALVLAIRNRSGSGNRNHAAACAFCACGSHTRWLRIMFWDFSPAV
jgi:hypothetical protein